MTLVLKDRVKETCTGTSGDMALTGAVSGYVAFDADATFDGNTTYYALEDADGTKWEVGLGTLSADSTTLTRTTILATQASFTDTTRQTFSSGTHTIYCVYPAGKSVHLDGSGVLSHSIVNADISNSAAIAIAKLASSSIGVSDGSSTTEISLGEDIQFRGTSNEVEVAESSGTITVGLPSSITANVTGDLTGNADTATNATNVTVADESTDTTCFPLFVTAATGNLAPKSGSNLSFNSSSGILTATGFAGDLTGDVTGNADTVTNGVYTSNNLSVMAATTSAQLAGVISDETGSGALVFATSPTLVTPALGTPTSGDLANCTFPTLNQDTTGTAAIATTVTVADESTDTTCFPLFVTAATGDLAPKSGTNLTFNSNTGILTATGFAGPLTGNVTGNVSGTAATVTGAAQSSITSLGTLTTLTVDNITIDGTTIGHTDDTDLMTLADGVVTVAGEISVTTLDIGGTNVTASASDINTVCSPDTVIGTRTVDGSDGIPHHDGDGVYVTDVDKFDDYFSSTTKTLTNKSLTSPTITGTGTIAGVFIGNTTALINQTGSISINASLGNYFTVATTGNITIDIQNAVVGQKILIRFAWGGDHTLGFANTTVIWPGGTAPGTTASGVDMIGFLCTTASSDFDGFIVGEDIKAS